MRALPITSILASAVETSSSVASKTAPGGSVIRSRYLAVPFTCSAACPTTQRNKTVNRNMAQTKKVFDNMNFSLRCSALKLIGNKRQLIRYRRQLQLNLSLQRRCLCWCDDVIFSEVSRNRDSPDFESLKALAKMKLTPRRRK